MGFCTNCGNATNGNKFCTKCGIRLCDEKQTKEEMRKNKFVSSASESGHTNKRNKKLIIVTMVLLAVIICVGLWVKTNTTVVGSWAVSERSLDENFTEYPENDFIIYDNGKFSCDNIRGTYSIDGNTITLSYLGLATVEYEYKVSGSELVLTKVEQGEKGVAIYYDRIK